MAGDQKPNGMATRLERLQQQKDRMVFLLKRCKTAARKNACLFALGSGLTPKECFCLGSPWRQQIHSPSGEAPGVWLAQPFGWVGGGGFKAL